MDNQLNLTMFLLKPGQVRAFEKNILTGVTVLPLSSPLNGVFVPLPSTAREPYWFATVRSVLQTPSAAPVLNSQTPAGLMVIHRNANTFVLTFGHAWQRLEDEWLERDFGRRIALNSIPRDQVVEIRAEQVFAKWHLASERAPHASSVDEFGVEFDRDLVAAVEGVPAKAHAVLGKHIRGGTSLRVTLPLSELNDVLDEVGTLFKSTAYAKTWPEIDNVSPVTDELLVAQLECQLDAEFVSGVAQRKLVMFTPVQKREGILDVGSCVFGRLSKFPVMRPYLTTESWLNFLKEKGLAPSVSEAKSCMIHLMDESKEEMKCVAAFDCFGYELSLNGLQYILSSGVWYEVVADFIKRINRAINDIPASKLTLPAWKEPEDEGDYNIRCAKGASFVNFDTKKLWFGGGKSQFEFCDLLHQKSKTLLFVKNPSKSSGMSHLVEQVRRTAELLFSTDAAYRVEVAKAFRKYYPTIDRTWLQSRPNNGEWRLCLVSIGRPAQKLPFFAKCSLVRVYKDLTERGHEVSFTAV